MRFLCGLLALLAATTASAVPAADGRTGPDVGVLVIGRISDDPNAHYAQLKPLLDYVVARMGDVGIHEGRILMARDMGQMESYLRRGRVDWVTETSAGAMLLEARAGAERLLLTERNGVRDYHTVFFARRDRGLASVADLAGRTIALQNASSTSAYYVPAMTLIARGMPMEILLAPRDIPMAGVVGYVFARSELNIATWVHKGLVDAGATSSLDWDDPRRMPASYRRDLVPLLETASYPRAVEMVRGDLDEAVRERLRQVLASAGDDPEAAQALALFFGTTRFLPLDAATRDALDELKAGALRVGAALE